MGRTVGELQRSISASEFTDWIAYHEINPIGAERLDILFAQLQATITNVRANRKRSSRAYRTDEFIPKWGPNDRPSSGAGLWSKIKDALKAAAPHDR